MNFKFLRKWQNIAFLLFVVVFMAGIGGGVFYILDWGGHSLPVTGQVVNFTATDISGKQVSLNSLNGKVRLVTWFYTNCPDECPLTAAQMEQIQNKLEQQGEFGKDVVFVSMTLDPTRDTLPVIRSWSAHFHPNLQDWYFVRATPQETLKVLTQSGVKVQQASNPVYLDHILKTELIDQYGNIRVTYNTADLNVNQVVSDINNLISRSHL